MTTLDTATTREIAYEYLLGQEKVTPRFVLDNAPNRFISAGVGFGDYGGRRPCGGQPSNLYHIGRAQFGTTDLFATENSVGIRTTTLLEARRNPLRMTMCPMVGTSTRTTLRHAIKIIVDAKSERQMTKARERPASHFVRTRIVVTNTWRIVAGVQDDVVRRDWFAAGFLVRNSVREICLPLKLKSGISRRPPRRGFPHPTILRLFDGSPQQCGFRDRMPLHRTLRRVVSRSRRSDHRAGAFVY